MTELLGAHIFAALFSIFADPIFFISRYLKRTYLFRHRRHLDFLRLRRIHVLSVHDVAEGYIPQQSWANIPEQRRIMMEYPTANLRVAEEA